MVDPLNSVEASLQHKKRKVQERSDSKVAKLFNLLDAVAKTNQEAPVVPQVKKHVRRLER